MNVTSLRAARRGTVPTQGSSRPGGRDAKSEQAIDDIRERAGRFRSNGNAALAEQPLPSAQPQEEQRPRLRLAPPTPVAAPRTPFVVLVVLIVVAGVLGILVLNTKIMENGLQLTKMQEEQGQLNVREQQLSQQIADAESPNNLAAAARKLGLVPAGTPAFIDLANGKVIGVPQPGTGEPSLTSD